MFHNRNVNHDKPHTNHAVVSSYNALWSAVITAAFNDAAYAGNASMMVVARRQARAWLTTDSEDLQITCDLANMDPEMVLRKGRALYG